MYESAIRNAMQYEMLYNGIFICACNHKIPIAKIPNGYDIMVIIAMATHKDYSNTNVFFREVPPAKTNVIIE